MTGEHGPQITSIKEINKKAGDEFEETANALESLGLPILADEAHKQAIIHLEASKEIFNEDLNKEDL